MSEIFPEFPLASLPAAVAAMGALPVPVGPEPQSLPLKVVVELNELRTRLAAVANPPREVFLALYDGAEPEVFTTVEAARECCDDLAKTDAGERYWDWTVNEFGIHIQFWTHPDDDRPLSETSGSVTPVVVQGDEPLSELERLRSQVAALLEERRSTNEALDDAVQELRADRDRIAVSDLCADCGHVEAAHAADAERPCDASGGRVRSCTCAWFMPREGLRLPSVAGPSCPCPPVDQPGPHQLGCPLDGVPGSSPAERPVNGLTATFMPVASLREVAAREEPHDSPLHQSHRIPHDLPAPPTCRLSADELDEVSRTAWFDGGGA